MMDVRDPPPLIGEAPLWLEALDRVSGAAKLDRPILVIGERGSGKELIAGRLHYLSRRWERALVRVNCAALSEELLESELFGHERGAFTGAAERRRGRFELADGGTLFLDEIATASARVQEKLLRVIEYGEFERLGGERTLTCDVRVVAAANVDLPARAAAGKFRADLLDRLAFDVITLPPLRARQEDIALLARHFARAMARELGEVFPGFKLCAIEALEAHAWPGNVRELKNAAERAVARWAASGAPDEPIEVIEIDPFRSPFRPPRDVTGDPGAGPAVARRSAPDSYAPDSYARYSDAPYSDAPGSAAPTPAAVQPSHGQSSYGQSSYGQDLTPDPRAAPFEAQVAAFEVALLRAALARTGGSQSKAASSLSLTYHQFRGLLRKHDLFGAAKAARSRAG
jgi:psp operon transcriptional activator